MSKQKFDPEALTLGELAKVEDLTGVPFHRLEEDGSRLKAMAAFVFVHSRRLADPKKWDECLALRPEEAAAFLGWDDDDTDPAEDDPEDDDTAEELEGAPKE